MMGSTAAAEAPRWEYNRGHPRRAKRKRDFKSHGMAVCTPRQQQQLQQQLKQEVEEKANVNVIGNDGKHVSTFRDKSHGLDLCAPYWEGCLMGQSHAELLLRAFCCWKISCGRKQAWGNRGLSAAVPKTIGFRPDGNKSSGMASRTP